MYNSDIHRDFMIQHVTDEIKKSARLETHLVHHQNIKTARLVDNQNFVRRLNETV